MAMIKRTLFVFAFFLMTVVPNSLCQAEDLFLRGNSGFRILVESEWDIDPIVAYQKAKETLCSKLKIYDVSYQELSILSGLDEELVAKDRGYGKVYRMRLSGFVTEEDIEKAKILETASSSKMLLQMLTLICTVLVTAFLSMLAFVKAERPFCGDHSLLLATCCAAVFLIACAFAVVTIG